MKIKIRKIIAFTIILSVLIATGCTRKIYIPTESARYTVDTIKAVVHRADSIYLRDSVYIASHGDTVIKEKYQWRIREKTIHDTICKIRQDTVRITIVKEADSKRESKRNFLSKIPTMFTYIIISAFIILICGIVFRKLK